MCDVFNCLNDSRVVTLALQLNLGLLTYTFSVFRIIEVCIKKARQQNYRAFREWTIGLN